MKFVMRFLMVLGMALCAPVMAQLPLPLANPELDLRARGTPRAAVPLPDGSVIVGGNFDWVGGDLRHQNLVRIRADGSVDSTWVVSVGGTVWGLAVDAEHVYVAGNFSGVQGQARPGLAKLRLADASLTAWNPNQGSSSSYDFRSIVLHGGSAYVGGNFTQVGATSRIRLAKIDPVTGAVDPAWTAQPNELVADVEADASGVYVSGDFTSVGGIARSYAAKLSLATGELLPWTPAFGDFITQAALDEAHFYAVGCFTSVEGQQRRFLARVDNQTGALDATWAPQPNGGCTYGLNLTSTQVYLGGAFTQINGQPAQRIGRVSKAGAGTLDATWSPTPDGPFVFGAVPMGSGSVLIYGEFVRVGAYSPGLARVGPSGALLSPGIGTEIRGNVNAIWPTADGGHIVGGQFTRAGAVERSSLLKLTSTGTLDPAFATGVQGTVLRLDGHAGQVYVAGSYSALGGTTIGALGRISETGVVDTSWRPNVIGFVEGLAVDPVAGTVLVGGSLFSAGGQNRQNLAELRLSDATATAWNPSPNGVVRRIALDGDALFIGGDFTSVGGVARQRLARVFRAAAGAVDAAFQADANSTVRALLLGPSNTLYVGGFFSSISGLGRPGFVRLNRSTGAPDPAWTTFTNSASVYDIAPSVGGLYVAGGFSEIGSQPRARIARIGHDGVVAPLFAPPAADGGPATTAFERPAQVLVGGFLNFFNPDPNVRRIGLFAYPLNATPVATTTTITSDSPERSQPFQVYRVTVNVVGAGGLPAANQRVDISDDRGELCATFLDSAGNGACEMVGRVPGTRQLTARFAGTPLLLASSATEPHTVAGESSTPPVNTAIDLRSASAPAASVRLSDGSLVIGGSFNRVGDQIRRGLAKLRPDGTLDTAFSADVIGTVTGLARDSADNIYVVGGFGYINGVLRRNIAKLTPMGSVVSAWTAGTTSIEAASGRTTLAVEADGNLLVQTAQTVISGSPNIRFSQIVRLSGSTGAVLPGFAVDLSTDSTNKQLFASLLVDGSDLYVYGSFDRVNATTRSQIARIRLATGALDPGFALDPTGPVAGVSYPVQRAIADGAGGLYLAGSFTQLAGQAVTQPARVSSAGAVSAAFAPTAFTGVDAMLLLDGGLYVSGANCLPSTPCTIATARMDTQTGQADPSFQSEFSAGVLHPLGPNLWLSNGAQLLDANGVLAMGAVQLRRTDGVRVPAQFITRPPVIRALARQPDGATLIGGRFARVGGNQENLVRVTAAGQFDTTFAPPVNGRFVQAIGVSGTGEIFVGTIGALLKFTPSGARDAAFGTGGELASNGTIYAFAPQPDGLLVGGFFGSLGGVNRQALVKLDPATGAVDPVWNAQISSNGGVLAMQRDATGDLYLGGTFASVGGQPRQNLARITSTGALSTSWNAPANSIVWSLLLDGNALYVGGSFSSLGGSSRQQIGRVDAVTAALQPWNPGGTTFAGAVRALARGQDGDIFVGGDFLRMGGAFRSRAAKLDPATGLADPNWNPSFDGPVYAILAGYGDTPPRGARLANIEQAISIGGDFEFAGPEPMSGFTAVQPVGLPAREIFCSGFEFRACE